jgi:hypothetical protein
MSSVSESSLVPQNKEHTGVSPELEVSFMGTFLPDQGEIINGKFTGKGVWTAADGSKYDGEFENNKIIKGVWTAADGTKYEGGFKDNERHGQGVETMAPCGTRYEGGFKDNERHGPGILTFASGTNYEGVWKDGEWKDEDDDEWKEWKDEKFRIAKEGSDVEDSGPCAKRQRKAL